MYLFKKIQPEQPLPAIYTLFPWKEKLGNANLQPKRANRLRNCYISGPKQNSEYTTNIKPLHWGSAVALLNIQKAWATKSNIQLYLSNPFQ